MSRTTADPRDRALARWGLAALLILTALAYLALAPAGFAWDDEALVVDNQLTGDLANLGELLTRDLWSTTRLESLRSGYYRPLFLLSLAADRAVFGLNATWAHLHSLAWHLGAVALLFALLRRLSSTPLALVGASLFALHPVQSEVLALIAARNDSMAAVFTFGALLLLLDPQERRPGRLAGAAVLALAALFSKESAVLVPLILLALDLARRRLGPGLRRGWPRYLVLALAVGAYATIRAALDLNAGIVPGDDSWGLVAEKFPQIAGVYAGLVVWPWPLTPARYIHYLAPLADSLPAMLVLLGLCGAAVVKGRDRGLVLAGLAWAVLTWLPTLAATLDKGLLGERYLYMPLAGLALVLAGALHRAPRWLAPAIALTGAAVLQLRLPDWHDSRTVWTRAHQVDPTPFTAAGLAWYIHRDGDYAQAAELLVQAIDGDPPYRDACDLVLMTLLQDKQPAKAVEIGEWALSEGRCRPDGLISHHLAVAYAGVGRWDDAVRTALERPGGPGGPSLTVVAAGRARAGDLEGLASIANQQPDPVAFVQQVAKLLRLGGEEQRAAEILQLLQRTDTPPARP